MDPIVTLQVTHDQITENQLDVVCYDLDGFEVDSSFQVILVDQRDEYAVGYEDGTVVLPGGLEVQALVKESWLVEPLGDSPEDGEHGSFVLDPAGVFNAYAREQGNFDTWDGDVRSVRLGTGSYTVELPGVPILNLSVMVNAIGYDTASCALADTPEERIRMVPSALLRVHCFDVDGAPYDSAFAVMVNRHSGALFQDPTEALSGYATVNPDPTARPGVPQVIPPSQQWNGQIAARFAADPASVNEGDIYRSFSYRRESTGRYTVTVRGDGPDLTGVVSAVRGRGNWCNVGAITGTPMALGMRRFDVAVKCSDVAGKPADQMFNLLVQSFAGGETGWR